MSDEFFIGWQGKAPAKTGTFLKRLTLGGMAVAVGLAAALPALQRTVAEDAKWEFGKEETFRGILLKEPVPMLVSDDRVVYLLVNPFKYGFDPELAEKHHLQHVTLEGTRIHRGDDEMIEVVAGKVEGSATPAVAAHPLGAPHELGEVTLRGEIVDSKCYLGVMNPGNLKPHRACAINCIEGGIPPVLLVRGREGSARYYLLVGEKGESLHAGILDLVAVPVRVTGQLKRLGGQLILYANPDRFSRE